MLHSSNAEITVIFLVRSIFLAINLVKVEAVILLTSKSSTAIILSPLYKIPFKGDDAFSSCIIGPLLVVSIITPSLPIGKKQEC